MKLRLFEPESDSLVELTELLHRAYAVLGDMGLNYTAVDQPVSVTRERVEDGECWVIEGDDGRLIGTGMLSFPFPTFDNEYFSVDGHAYLNQFAIDPEFQGRGLGEMLLGKIEERAREEGAPDIGLDTAEQATHLIRYYRKHGYEIVDYIQYGEKRYRSVIMSKPLQ